MPPSPLRSARAVLVSTAAAVLLAGSAAAQSTYPAGTRYPYPSQGQSYPGQGQAYPNPQPYPSQGQAYPGQAQAPRDAAGEAWAQVIAQNPQSNDAALNRRVRTIGDRLVSAAGADSRGWDYRVFVNDSPNAFVLPGGRVGVNTGLFKVVQNDDQLAAVLGHEIAHNQYNHAAQRSTRTGLAQLGLGLGARIFGRNDPRVAEGITRFGGAGAQLGFLLPFSRKQELEADRLGVDYMARAGFRPSQASALWRNFQSARAGSAPQFMSTHPSDATRIQQLDAYVRSRGYQ